MASTIKVDQIEGSTGSTITVPTGQTLTLTDGLASASLPVVGVAKGGTSFASFTAGDVLYATGSTTLAKLPKGTAEQVLAMNSGATAPDWGSVDLTVLPTISVAKGGTNLSSFTAGDILYATGTTTLAKLAKGSAAEVLTMNSGATAPEWAESAGGGKLGQVITMEFNSTIAGVQSIGTFASWPTAIQVQITPSANDSKIYVTANGLASTGGSSNGMDHAIFNGATELTKTGLYGSATNALIMNVLHSPASTSQQTYEWKTRVNSSGGHWSYLYSGTANPARTVYMTAMEILN
jgi:hypothetical protein